MTDKEFRQLKRTELIDIIYEYQKREKQLQKEIRKLKNQLQDKELKIRDAGSIAEAALKLNGVFEAAQNAADEYLAYVEKVYREADQKCEKMLADAETQANQIVVRARMKAAEYTGEAIYEFPSDVRAGSAKARSSELSGEGQEGDLEFIDLDFDETEE